MTAHDSMPADLRDSLAELVTESVDPALADIDMRATDDLVRLMTARDAEIVPAVSACHPQITAAIDGITCRLQAGGRLIYLGAGTAGRLGVLDASEIPPTFGTSPELVQALIAGGPQAIGSAVENAEDDAEAGQAALADLGLTDRDAVVGIAASGRTPYVLGGLGYAHEVGAFTVGLSNNPTSAIGRAADVAIDVVIGGEFVAGSTRLRSGSAQKLVLNMITTITMVRLGKTYGNLMVDLRATNDKLRARSLRTITAATGAQPGTAESALREADGSVKLAILIVETGLSAEEARSLLAAHGGYLRAAIDTGAADRSR